VIRTLFRVRETLQKNIETESTGVVEKAVIQQWEKGYPYVPSGRHRVPALEKSLGNVFLAGDYLDESLMETTASGLEAARSARRLLEAVSEG
jgi:hypothetical protein